MIIYEESKSTFISDVDNNQIREKLETARLRVRDTPAHCQLKAIQVWVQKKNQDRVNPDDFADFRDDIVFQLVQIDNQCQRFAEL